MTPTTVRDRISVVYNGIAPSRFEGSPRTDLQGELKIEQTAPVVGFVGQLDERKGIHTLFQAFEQVHAKVPSAVLVVVGEGPLDSYIRDWCHQHRLDSSVRLAGFRDDIPEVMKNIDMLILPSLWEGFGIVLIEAMAAAKACVTTNVSSMPEIVVDGETGLVVPVSDPVALADAVIRLLTNPELLIKCGERGRQRVLEMFTLSRKVDELESLFMGAISS